MGQGNREGKLHNFGDELCAGTWNVDAVISVVIRGGSKVPPINTVGGPRCGGCQVPHGKRLGCREVLGVCG